MLRLFSFVSLIVAIASGYAQPMRVELLSRTADHDRKKADATIAMPEFSRDGNLVLYLSAANNLTTNSPVSKPALNLYMFDRRTLQTTLVSQAPNGAPANGDVVNFEITADNRRVLFETSASNIVGNDTNDASDVFIRDLELKTNILVSATTNGVISRSGARNATMSSDGNFVLFLSEDKSLSAQTSSAFVGAFVRNIAAGTTESLKAPPGNDLLWASDTVISDDGRFAAFSAETKSTGSSGYVSMNVLCDLQSGASVQMAGDITGSYQGPPIMTPDGKFVIFEINNFGPTGTTNVVVRYASDTGASDIAASNNVVSVRPVAISTDRGTILSATQSGYRIYRDNAEMRAFPKQADGNLISLPSPFASAAMSADGKVVTFSTDAPLLAVDGDTSQFRTYVYDVEQDLLTEIPLTAVGASPSDPVPNADGSIVVFTGPGAGIHEQGEAADDNIYLWERATGQIQLVSKLDARAFANTDASDSKIPETAAFSDDGQKIVFASRAPATGVADANGSWDVFVLDRATGQKQLVSVAEDGQSTGSGASLQPIISGNGQFVAFFSRATNLVAVDTQGRLELYVRDIVSGLTRLVRNKDAGAPSRAPVTGSLSFSADGKLLCFASRATDLDARDSQPISDIYVYDTVNDTVNLVTYDATKTTSANADCINPAISRDGRFVVFRSTANNLGASGNSFDVCIRDLKTGTIRKTGISVSASGAFKNTLQFNPDSTVLYFASYGPHFYSYSLTNTSFTNRAVVLVTNVYEGSASADGKWIAITRRTTTSPFSTQVYLRNVTNRVEFCISSNMTAAAIGNDNSSRPQISADGRFTIFESRASNLIANDTNAVTDLFIYDRDRQRLDLLSAKTDGGVANGSSVRGVICPDESCVAFVSFASDLVPHDYNEGSDIFAAYLPQPDTDSDGIDDRWELAHFGTLDHDMTGDADNDGMSDAAEFQAQTDPNQASSTLRLISATVDAGQNVIVRWTSTPGRAYRLQARSRFEAGSDWQDISDAFVSAETESAITLPLTASSNEFFFRVITAD